MTICLQQDRPNLWPILRYTHIYSTTSSVGFILSRSTGRYVDYAVKCEVQRELLDTGTRRKLAELACNIRGWRKHKFIHSLHASYLQEMNLVLSQRLTITSKQTQWDLNIRSVGIVQMTWDLFGLRFQLDFLSFNYLVFSN